MKIAICIPRYGDTKGEFTISLARMLVHTLSAAGAARPEIEIFSVSSSDLPGSRDLLLQRAIEWQARYLLWLDADHVFPAQALVRLLAHRLPVVGCRCPRITGRPDASRTSPLPIRRRRGNLYESAFLSPACCG